MEYLSVYLCFSVSSISVLKFSVNRSFTSLVKSISKYFILFDAVVNGIAFLISLSDSLVYGNTVDFFT